MLNANLDLDAFAAAFARCGRVQLREFLDPEVAETLHGCLARDVSWSLAYRMDGQAVMRTGEELAAMSARDRADLGARIQQQARDGYQFLYNSYRMITAYLEGRDTHLPLHMMVEFINSPEYLDFARRVTAVDNIIKADAQATRYMPGHFLRKHNDLDSDNGLEVAYVMNFSRDWQADWGGLLQFLDDDGNVIDTFAPHFNSLSLFRVPMLHCVSYVCPYARNDRLAITGWLRSR